MTTPEHADDELYLEYQRKLRPIGPIRSFVAAVGAGEDSGYSQELAGLLRLLTPGWGEAHRVFEQTWTLAHAHRPPGLADRPWERLAGLAFEQLGMGDGVARALPAIRTTPDLAALRAALNRLGPSSAQHGGTPTDDALLVLVQVLPLECRRALALTTLYGMDAGDAESLLGPDIRAVARLRDSGLRQIHQTLSTYASRQLRPTLASKPLPRLVPLPMSTDGVLIVRGTSVYIDPATPSSMVAALVKLLAQLQDRLRHALHLSDPTDDNVGAVRRHRPLDPTPTTQPIRKPQLTPSLEPHRMPRPTSGTGLHRRAPEATPSMQRLSTRTGPLARAASTYSWLKR